MFTRSHCGACSDESGVRHCAPDLRYRRQAHGNKELRFLSRPSTVRAWILHLATIDYRDLRLPMCLILTKKPRAPTRSIFQNKPLALNGQSIRLSRPTHSGWIEPLKRRLPSESSSLPSCPWPTVGNQTYIVTVVLVDHAPYPALAGMQ